MSISSSARKCAHATLAISCIVALTACDQLVAPGARKGIRYHYGDFLLPIAAVHMPDTISDGQVSLTFDVEPGENPCAFANYVTVMSADAIVFIPYGVHHPGTSCKTTAMAAWRKLPASSYYVVDSLGRVPLRVVICQQYRSPIVKQPFITMPKDAQGATRLGRNAGSIASYDARFCRRVVDDL